MAPEFNIEEQLKLLLMQEDTDKDDKITIKDTGPRCFLLTSTEGKKYEISGTYRLSVLLKELAILHKQGKTIAPLNIEHLFESPVKHISRLIKDRYWKNLTRRIDREGLDELLTDSKAGDKTTLRMYVPDTDQEGQKYFSNIADSRDDLEVVTLPKDITPEYVKSINDKPGILSLALKKNSNGKIEGTPFVVPGGRFNELYGWDSFFEVLGLLEDGYYDLARDMVDNFVYEINHYGKILNANRSYYLMRSQPPFLTSMALEVFNYNKDKEWLTTVLHTAIKEYHTVWMSEPHLTHTGLSRYFGSGLGLPIEVEPGHFDAILSPYASQLGMDIPTYIRGYQDGSISNPQLDEFIKHDRAMRESGHDTSYRLVNCCADLNTVDLNSLLFKYETDIAHTIEHIFENSFNHPEGNSKIWFDRAKKRQKRMSELFWDEQSGFFYDYNFTKKEHHKYANATTFYPLWAGWASSEQAAAIVEKALPMLEEPGGIVSCTKESRGKISPERPQRQWDYPFGWPPHQILAWQGLKSYGYDNEVQRLAYRWLHMIVHNAIDYNGTIPEKYDVVQRTHNVFVEYGNIGTDFSYISEEGFGWMNSSFQLGLTYLTNKQYQQLEAIIAPEWIF